MDIKKFIFVLPLATALTGCSHVSSNNNQSYIAAINDKFEINPLCGAVVNPYGESPNCSKTDLNGYQFARAASSPSNSYLSFLEKIGFAKAGKEISCSGQNAIPFAIKKSPYVSAETSETGGEYVCIGNLTATKIVSATSPHYSSKYSMKTVVVNADIGIQGISDKMLKMYPPIKQALKEKNKSGISTLNRNFGTVTVVLGEISPTHWKVMHVISGKRYLNWVATL